MTKKVDQRDKKSTDKCKDCKYAKKVDRWNLVCTHPIWKDGHYGGTSYLMGNSTCACRMFERR